MKNHRPSKLVILGLFSIAMLPAVGVYSLPTCNMTYPLTSIGAWSPALTCANSCLQTRTVTSGSCAGPGQATDHCESQSINTTREALCIAGQCKLNTLSEYNPVTANWYAACSQSTGG